jgi:hypothetical protein
MSSCEPLSRRCHPASRCAAAQDLIACLGIHAKSRKRNKQPESIRRINAVRQTPRGIFRLYKRKKILCGNSFKVAAQR